MKKKLLVLVVMVLMLIGCGNKKFYLEDQYYEKGVITEITLDELNKLEKEDELLIGKIYTVINKIAKQEGIDEKGFRVIVNCGEDGGQEVKHLHFHILGGKKLGTKICD